MHMNMFSCIWSLYSNSFFVLVLILMVEILIPAMGQTRENQRHANGSCWKVDVARLSSIHESAWMSCVHSFQSTYLLVMLVNWCVNYLLSWSFMPFCILFSFAAFPNSSSKQFEELQKVCGVPCLASEGTTKAARGVPLHRHATWNFTGWRGSRSW